MACGAGLSASDAHRGQEPVHGVSNCRLKRAGRRRWARSRRTRARRPPRHLWRQL